MTTLSRNRFILLLAILVTGGIAWWLVSSTLSDPDDSSPTAPAGNAESVDSLANEGDQRSRGRLPTRKVSPASDHDWIAPGADPVVIETLLKDPVSQFDVFVDAEWTDTNVWASIPDIGGPWSLARRECASEKLGFVVQEPCDYFVNIVVRRDASGAGEVVAARAEFDTNSLAGEEDAHLSGDPSLASARCRGFARCLVARGYAKVENVPLPPGAEGDLIAFQIAGRELPKPDGGPAALEQRLDAAIEGTLQQLRMFEDNPDPANLSWHFNVALLRRALEYYRWLKTQI